MTTTVALHTTDSIESEIERLHRAICERAYAICRDDSVAHEGELSDWLTAERELVWRPAAELRRKGGRYEVLVATAGVPLEDLDVEVSPDDVVIKGNVHHRHTAAKGEVELCEFHSGELFRLVHFPERVDTTAVKTAYTNGLLQIIAPIAQ